MVGEVGLEPTKAKPADLQSAPFAARDTPPNLASGRMRGSSRVMGSALGGVNRATSAGASAENATDVLILAPPHGTLAAKAPPGAHAVRIRPPRSSPIAAAGSARPRAAVRHRAARAHPAMAR